MFKDKYIVDKDFILENRDDENFKVIDARGDMLKVSDIIYDNAIVLDWKEFTFLNGEMGSENIGLPFSKEVLLEKFKKYGINENSKVLIYIDTKPYCGMGEDGRFKYLLGLCNIESFILDGGVSEILKTKYTKEILNEEDLKKAEIDFESKPFLKYKNSILTDELLNKYNESNVKIIDVRLKDEFEGKILFGEKFGGHIKNAISFPYVDLYDEKGYLLENSILIKKFEDIGLDYNSEIILYCTTGIRASIVYEIMKMLGYNVKIYDESFMRWCNVGDYEI